MKILEKSIRKIKQKNFISYKQWNRYAKEHKVLTAQTIECLTGKTYKELRTS